MHWIIQAVLCVVVAVQLREVAPQFTECTVNTPADYTIVERTRNKEWKCIRTCNRRFQNQGSCIGYVYDEATDECKLLSLLSTGLNVTFDSWNVRDEWVNRACPKLKYSFDGNDKDASAITYGPNEASIVKPVGSFGNGLDLIQTDDTLSIGDPVANDCPLTCSDAAEGCNGLTLAFWIKITNKASGYNYIFHGQQMRFREFQGRMDAYMYYWSNSTFRQKASIDLTGFTDHDTWIHVALVFDTDPQNLNLKLYIDGQDTDADLTLGNGSANNLPAPFESLKVNTARNLGHNALIQMDELLGFDKPLSATEVQDLYNTY